MRPITASDLMNPEVLTVREDASVEELAAFLIDNEISGAPVVDRLDRLVGVVSVVDIAAVTAEDAETRPDRSASDFFSQGWGPAGVGFEEEIDDLEMDEDLTVADLMNPEIYSVPEDASASEVARLMLDAHVHRVLVLRDGAVVGIISTSDLLGLLVDVGEG